MKSVDAALPPSITGWGNRWNAATLLRQARPFGVLGVVLLMLLVLWSLIIGFSVFQSRRQIDAAIRELTHLRSAVVHHTGALVQAIDTDLRVIDQWLQANPRIEPLGDERFNALVHSMVDASGGLIDLRLASTRGHLHRLSEHNAHEEADVDDGEYFADLQRQELGQIHIGSPVLDRMTGRWVIPISMRLTQPVGGMEAAVAFIDIPQLQNYHERFRMGDDGAVALLRDDGTLLSRTPQDDRLNLLNVSAQAYFPMLRDQHAGSFRTPGPFPESGERLASFEHLGHFPLMVVLGRDVDAVLAGYYERRRWVIAVGLLFTGLCLYVAWLLQQAQRQSHVLRRDAQSAHALLLAASDALPLGQFQTDSAGRLTWVNEAWRKIHQLPEGEEPAAWVNQLAPPARAPEGQPPAAQGYLMEGEHTLVMKTGQRLYIRVKRADILLNAQVAGCSGTVEDVTEQRHTQQSQRLLTDALDHSTDIVVQSDWSGRFLYINAAFRRFAGIASDTPAGSIELKHIADLAYLTRRDAEIMPTAQRQGFWQGETQLRNAQGELRDFNHLLLLHRLDDGRVSHITGILRDITAQKHAEAELRKGGLLLASIADRLPMRVSFVDLEQRYRFLNKAYEHSFGKSRDALYGCTVREVLGDTAYQRAQPYLERALRGEPVSFEGELTTAGSYHCYHAEYVPQFEPDNVTPLGCVVIITDTTEQKQRERRLLELSQRDPLTGLYNRAGFDLRLRDAVLKTQGADTVLALLYLDVDHFKRINDSLGHLAGDVLLQGFGGRLAKTLRSNDVIARLGGDEFAVILENVDNADSVERIAANLVHAMRPPFILEDREIAVTTSIGVAVHQGAQAPLPRDLIQRADQQLYTAKKAGRDGYCMERDLSLSKQRADIQRSSARP